MCSYSSLRQNYEWGGGSDDDNDMKQLSLPLHLPFIHFALGEAKVKNKESFQSSDILRMDQKKLSTHSTCTHHQLSLRMFVQQQPEGIPRKYPSKSFSRSFCECLSTKGSMNYCFLSPLDTRSPTLSIRVGHVLRNHLRSDFCRVNDRPRKLNGVLIMFALHLPMPLRHPSQHYSVCVCWHP